MVTRIRTLNFLPDIFKTTTNSQFLNATLDQIVQQPNTRKIEGYIGSKFGYGVNATNKYVVEPNKTRTDYQLDPGVVFLKKDTGFAQDFISYPGIIDALNLAGGVTNDNSRMFESQFYSWDSFTNLDKIINFNQYYWVPEGPEAVTVSTGIVYKDENYVVTDTPNGYLISAEGSSLSTTNPYLTLLRGGTYTFTVDQNTQFWIQGVPGVTGFDPAQVNVQTRDVLGVENNGATQGVITFTVPEKDAQNEYDVPGNNSVDIVTTLPFAQVNGALISAINGLDGITSLDGLTLMFYDTGVENEQGFIQPVSGPGYYTDVAATFYQITVDNGQIILSDYAPIPTGEKITAKYGTQWIGRSFFRNTFGQITLIPYLSAVLDTLYYQDGSSENKVGQLRLIEANATDRINIIENILGRKNYTSPNGVVFTNGLKIIFDGNIYPTSYENTEYYVEGVGTAITLIPVDETLVPEPFTFGSYIPYDTLNYDIGNYDVGLYVPVTPDYITIARNAINKNAWSRSNRWFHIDVLNATAAYNNNPDLLSLYTTNDNKAKRPIIEFYPNLRLFNSGIVGKAPVNFIDQRTTDAFTYVAGQENYYPDVQVYTAYTATINAASGSIITTATATTANPNNAIVCTSTAGFRKNDKVTFTGTTFGGITASTTYYIESVVDSTSFTITTEQNGDVLVLTAGSGTMTVTVNPLTTTIDVATSDITGTLQVGQYVVDSTNLLPINSRIQSISSTSGTTTIVVYWDDVQSVSGTTVASIIANDINNDNYQLFDGARIVFTEDTNPEVRNKVYVAHFATPVTGGDTVITLTLADDATVLPYEQVVAYSGYNNLGKTFYFDGTQWIQAQQKNTVNQPPLFDVFDKDGISFGNETVYQGTSFTGNKLFAYGIGSGIEDIYLGFPLRYSSVDNVGDISFDVSLNLDTFNYVNTLTNSPVTKKVNTGYVYNYTDIATYDRMLGWQTAIGPSVQYQLFEFNYYASNPVTSYTCDISMLNSTDSPWPTIQVFVNNVLQPRTSYTTTVTPNSTIVNFTVPEPLIDTVVEVALLSNQVSKIGFYGIPINLNNNPLNQDLSVVNIGDIRGQYQSIYYNNPNTVGNVFGPNNYRDLGDVVPYGTRIIQNSASLVLPGTFLRQQNHNLFDALMFNSKEYINFKTLLVSTVNNTDYNVYQTPAFMLDDALDQITANKTDGDPFFWSDMLPGKSAYITNTYSFANALDISIYPLSKIYNFNTANYNGVLVYLTRNNIITQLINNVDYTVSVDAPSLTVTLDLLPNDQITIKEYNQTYGSYVPNTPTKLGLYPSTIPSVVLDSNYNQPTYFIVGHDGSYNKLYGDYVNGQLVDFRDKVLLEFETRIYNNLKLGDTLPISEYDILPGFFRDTDYSYDEILEIYSSNFLNWVGQNRIDYKTQYYNANNEYTYNYNRSGNKINNEPIPQGYWRGIYQYFYDTANPDTMPWQMIGFTDKPTWWETRYGPAPYTSDNLVLWGDLAQGINWNNGNPVTLSQFVRPELLQVLPVDSNGDLVSPFVAIVRNYTSQTFMRDWKVGDVGPAEFSYRRSSTWPFDLMKIMALTKPAQFFNLGVDLDNYRYNSEFNQYLVNDRSHLIISDVEIYGNGTAKTSYINWIVDYEKQVGIDATTNITDLLDNLDVRLVYRLAGFSDKNLLKFYVEKGTPNSNNASLLIPDESYSVLLYDNPPFDRIIYSGVIIQISNDGYFKVYGNSQTNAYFKVLKPKINGNYETVTVDNYSVKLPNDYSDIEEVIAYGTTLYSIQEVATFLKSYGKYLQSQGVLFEQVEVGMPITWEQMVAEFLYWAQSGWDIGSIININPAAKLIAIDKVDSVVQPLTLQRQNFILNQNLYPIQSVDLSVVRDGTAFTAQPLNQGDTVAYGQFNMYSFEHGIVFDNVTLFDDIIYNLVTGLRQNRIYVRGTKTAEWNGTIDAQGFILNQDNIIEWSPVTKYTTGSIVTYKNKYWIATKIIQPAMVFQERDWKETDYNEIQKGLLPNSSTRSYESTLYYDVDKANLEQDADLLSFSLIGYRPRDYLALADLTDITQINVYKNLIKNKGTRNATEAFKGATLPQGGIDYDIYENWAIKTSEFGGVLNNNFVEFRLNQTELTGNPSIVGLTTGYYTNGVQQEVPLYNLYNYGRPVTDPNVLPVVPAEEPSKLFPDAGYVNFNDVKISSYFYSGLINNTVPLSNLYVGDYVWLANYQGTWNVMTPVSQGEVVLARSIGTDVVSLTFDKPHSLTQYTPFALINFNSNLDGYYIANSIVDPYTITITIPNLGTPFLTAITGNGIVVTFQSNRVRKTSDITNLPLLNNEFVKDKVWVDTASNGSWAVYRKSLNYQYSKEFTNDGSLNYGSAVAYADSFGYLIGDNELGEVYRYVYNPLRNRYDLVQTLTGDSSFGSTISYSGNIVAISQPTGATASDRKVRIYEYVSNNLVDELQLLQTIDAPDSLITSWGSALAVSGDLNWLYVSDTANNTVYVYRKSLVDGLYAYSTVLPSVSGLVSGDNFGSSLSTNYYGDTVTVGAPNIDVGALADVGYAYAFDRLYQNFEAATTSIPFVPLTFNLAVTVSTTSKTATNTSEGGFADYIKVTSGLTGVSIDDPVVFSGTILSAGALQENRIYYVVDISGSRFKVSTTRGGAPVTLSTDTGTMTCTFQTEPVFVSVNGTTLSDDNYFVVGSVLSVISTINAGDIINVSTSTFVLSQTFASEDTTRVGPEFGTSVANNSYATEILVGAPFEIRETTGEGAIYRYTNSGGKYGYIIGTGTVAISAPTTILINGYAVSLVAGDATSVANAILAANITNVTASAVDGKLTIALLNTSLATVNDKLNLAVLNDSDWAELGIDLYTRTEVITCPHTQGATQFGTVIKFNEYQSFVASAVSGNRYVGTTFDSTDDENFDNDTIFDNNATQFVDVFKNAGAVYMFDYLENYNETLLNVGKFVYAQSTNSLNTEYGNQPLYGKALDFNNYTVVVGSPNFEFDGNYGQVISYVNDINESDWFIYRNSSSIVDINKIQNAQLFSAENNQTLVNLDYIDPLQGKILGSVRQNIDIVSNTDPANYNSPNATNKGSIVWGPEQVGQVWFNTNNVRFVNYHQNDDVEYNSQYWGQVFPGSDVAVYSWIASNELPVNYQGPGTPHDLDSYVVFNTQDTRGMFVPVYYYWVRNTNIVFTKRGKTLSDTIIESYITNPKNSGISYFAPLLPNVFGLYNTDEYVNNTDTVFHVGFSTGTNDDVAHAEYSLIRANYADDFLPGLPINNNQSPISLYDRLLDSLSGVDETGAVVPDPFLPKAVQSGIYARPRQSFFVNRFGALKNYLTYANEIIAQYPITETKNELTFLFKVGDINPSTGLPFYDTQNFWNYINWWATGYDNNTKSVLQVPLYADLSALSVPAGTIVTVAQNNNGNSETYVLQTTGTWERIGLQNGTIEFKSTLWDYNEGKFGFGGSFYDTTVYDEYPSEETRYIIRAINEQIFTDELLIHRNKGLILLFEYIQSETIESQNYLPWLNKTSLVDVSHTIRELRPIEVFQSDNQQFLSSYLNEAKPYHVVIKDFLFKYTGTDVFEGDITDFDLPAKFNFETNQFITPELVYSSPSTVNQYLPTDSIWQTTDYSQWFNNYGLSITGVDNYQITVLSSYIALNSQTIVVDNVSGFPVNGVIRIGDEQIGYSDVDRSTNTLFGLTRGVNETAITTHIPGENIYINLPAALLLNAGRGYVNPPRITAYIDTSIYPEPRQAAILEPVMNLDKILSINVINPGDGYAVLPEIIIDPSITVSVNSDDVSTTENTIRLLQPLLQTGDLVRYTVGADTTAIGGLDNGQYYYVNVLDTTPSFIIALYTTYSNAVNDVDRVTLYSTGSGSNNNLSVSAKASCVTNSQPIRENQITLRFDRTSYNSEITEWQSGEFYGSFYAGLYNNSETISSSSIGLYATQPPIDTILASFRGAPFQISNVTDDLSLTWSSRTRNVVSTTSGTNVITIEPSEGGAPDMGSVSPTTGFYVGMPIKFVGSVGTSGLSDSTTYYVNNIVNGTDFTVSASSTLTPTVALNTTTIGTAGLLSYIGQVVDTTIITIDYPGIRNVSATAATTNALTVDLTFSGQGGTSRFYPGLPISFVGNVFGSVIENEIYYVTTIIDDQTFTMSTNSDPELINVTATNSSGNIITCESTLGLSVNDPVIFNNMTISGSTVSSFGGITSGIIYYVATVLSPTTFTIATAPNSSAISLTTQAAGTGTGCIVTNQKDTAQLSTATGNMTLNVGLPLSPGQVNGQRFTLYQSVPEFGNTTPYTNITGTTGDLLTYTITHTVSAGDEIILFTSGGSIFSNMYVNMPFRVASNIGNLTTGTTYYITDFGNVTTTVTGTATPSNILTCNSTDGFYVDMPVKFSGTSLGGIDLNTTYFIVNINSSTEFEISTTMGGSSFAVYADAGTMTVTGSPYITASTSIGGLNVTLSDATGNVTATQYVTGTPIFDIGYTLGGYYVDNIVDAGSGFAVTNTITILGSDVGGVDGVNDLTIMVNTVDTQGEILTTIVEGTPPGTVSYYYLKVISETQCEVYYDPLMQIPVPINDFVYVQGDYALLPEPFYFNQSIVKYGNNVYQCIVSNNDTEFIPGKWLLLDSGSRELNALDRIIGYYKPEKSNDLAWQNYINMPGLDLTQLVRGIVYPNSTYLGNAFAPDEEFPLDVILQDQPFTPSNVDIKAVIYDGSAYYAPAVIIDDYSALLVSQDGVTWNIEKLAEQPIDFTDMIYANSRYLIASDNNAISLLFGYTGTIYSPIVTGAQLNSIAYNNGTFVTAGNKIIRSTDLEVWTDVYTFTNGYNNTINSVSYVDVAFFTGFIAVGKTVIPGGSGQYGIILTSIDGVVWTQSAFTLADYGLNSVAANSDYIVAVGENGSIISSTNASNWVQEVSGTTETLNNIVWGYDKFVVVGGNTTGTIITAPSTPTTWTLQTSGTTELLNDVVYNSLGDEYIVVGENNTILQSSDAITWVNQSKILLEPTKYNIQGSPFLSGYGPEELVPGVVSDNLTMIVNTRPGTNWDETIYQHVGYSVVTREITQTVGTQSEFSFDDMVEVPSQIAVYLVDSSTGLGTRLYEINDYTSNWLTKTITLTTAPSIGDKIMICVYDVGNGDQLVKSSTDYNPIQVNDTTGFCEIQLDCNYTGTRSSGSGVMRPTTTPINVTVISTSSVDNSILCESVDEFVINSQITFQGSLFGGITADTPYYVKTRSYASNRITISNSIIDGVAGPVFNLTTASGPSMTAIVQTGNGLVWTDPIVYHNGSTLILGTTLFLTNTSGDTNTIYCNTTGGIAANDPIVFSDTMFGDVIVPQTVYYVKQVIDGNEFTISETLGGPTLALTTAAGGAIAITNDYAFIMASNSLTANMIFASQYNNTTDFISYTILGETYPEQYRFTIPQLQTFVADGSTTVFNLTNYVSGSNPENAVVEVNGVRLSDVDYVIDGSLDTLTMLYGTPASDDVVAITSYNSTTRQYFNTQYDITGNIVSNIVNISNDISVPIATSSCTSTSSVTNEITCADTTGFVVDQTVEFKAPSSTFGGIVAGTIYYIESVTSSTTFKISTTQGGSAMTLTTDSGVMVAYVGGQPAVRVTTGITNGFTDGDLVRLDGVVGPTQLNNQVFYARIISSTQFDLYNQPYDSSYNAINDPVTGTTMNAYISGGYVWKDQTYILQTTRATATDSSNNITVNSVDDLVLNTPIVFTGTTFGNIVEGTVYYIIDINIAVNTIKISETHQGPVFVLSVDTGDMAVTQWKQDNVDRLWVTVNGYRVPSSSLFINDGVNISILTTITAGDTVTITSMIPSETPNQVTYIQNVGKTGIPSVYRADPPTTTWLTQPLYVTNDTIYVNDASKLVTTNTFVVTVDSVPFSVQLGDDKNSISNITVYNKTTSTELSSNDFHLEIQDTAPVLVIESSISIGNEVEITVVSGNLLYVNGEQIKFSSIDFTTNSISGLQRGANGTGVNIEISIYSRVYGILSSHKMADPDYYVTWNSYVYNTVEGDPLQISDTNPAIFLRTDIP